MLRYCPKTLILTRRIFIDLYGFELSYPGTAAEGIAILEKNGCSKAQFYYDREVKEYEQKKDEMLRRVARQLWGSKKGVRTWTSQEAELLEILKRKKDNLQQREQLLRRKKEILLNGCKVTIEEQNPSQ